MSKLWTLLGLAALMIVGSVAHASGVVLINGRTMMPLNSLKDHFGASISYDSRNGIGIRMDYQQATLYPNSRRAHFGNRAITLDADVIVLAGVTYVPVSFIDYFGYRSSWDQRAQQVIIIQPRTQHRVVLINDRNWDRYCRQHDRWDCRTCQQSKPRLSTTLSVLLRLGNRDRSCDTHERSPRFDRNDRYDRDSRYDRNDRYDRECDHHDHGKGYGKGKGKGKR